MTRQDFETLTSSGIVIVDGAMGSNLFLAGMPKGVCAEQWVLEHPEVVIDLQRRYIDAGSQIIYAPTFGANRRMLESYGLGVRIFEMNRDLVAISKQAAGDRAYVAGDVAPTGLVLDTIGGEATYEQVFEIYVEQIQALVDAGVDLIIIETMMSQDETTIALDAALSVTEIPVMCSMSVQADGMAYCGGTIFEAAETLEAMGASAVGVNCCSGPDQLESLIRTLKEMLSIPVIAKPNAGMPKIDQYGHAVYDMAPDVFGKHMKNLVNVGAGIVGGCCGTNPEYIRALCAEIGR